MYILHSDGGPHYFSQCEIEVKDIYRKNIWPYLERIGTHSVIKNSKKSPKPGIMLGSIGSTKLGYVYHRIYKKELRKKKDYRGKKIIISDRPYDKEISMHRIVAQAFINNSNPEKKLIVDHINGNRVDYRINNLRWVSHEENAGGTPGGRNSPNEIYKLISKKDWFNQKGTNMLNTKKKGHSQIK